MPKREVVKEKNIHFLYYVFDNNQRPDIPSPFLLLSPVRESYTLCGLHYNYVELSEMCPIE